MTAALGLEPSRAGAMDAIYPRVLDKLRREPVEDLRVDFEDGYGVHADADDAWSDTFLAAMKAYPDLPADANLEAWLVTIAHRKAIDITRATARRAIPIADTPDTPSRDHADESDPDLTEAVAALPIEFRETVVLRELEGLSYKEISEVSGVPIGTVMSRLARGRHQLYLMLSKQTEHGLL